MSPRMRRSLVLATGFLWAAAAQAPGADRGLHLIVTRPMFTDAVAPLAAHRRKEGFRVVVSTKLPAKAIADAWRLAFVLLVGDDQPGKVAEPWYLPARRVRGHYWFARRPTRTFASDAVYGDLDGDDLPDVPVGRIPARTAEQAALVVRKILAYESQAPSLDDLRLPFWAGAPMFGPEVDSLATELALQVLRTYGPKWLCPWVLSADLRHPLCGWPPDQPGLYTGQLRRSGALAALMGHGGQSSLHAMQHQGRMILYGADEARRP